jgi:two-component system chemotaxis sensor kinase CheA
MGVGQMGVGQMGAGQMGAGQMGAGQMGRPARAETPEPSAPRTLRVDQEKVDTLMNLIGELVVAKNSLPFLARRAEQHFGLRELGREIKDQYGVIDRIAQELQGAVMAVRMMPVGQVFQRFPRLVRDLARKLGKHVDLVIEGEATEADKNVIESLFDPLLHMVRNSLDHGIETPEERVARGKPETATVRLLARHDGDQVVIEVVDDGRGIDPDAIKRKAYERGLLDEARLASITDDDAKMLVFAAGFSTAETVSDVSGRGVGMDVVRNAVERAGGRIAMTSIMGGGTTVRLNLPLSMAVSRVMTVALDDRLFGIPMDLIHGTVKVPRAGVVRIKGSEAFVLRDRVVPLLHLSRLLELPDQDPAAEELAVLVVRVEGQTIGLGISSFGEGMEVILKPLEGMLAKIVGYTGTALLGDGRVLLVLDLKELIQ